jgi:hypothetical protein
MRKKSRQKKGRSRWTRPRSNDVFRRGPLSIARFGRHVLFSNRSTPEEHRDFLQKAAEANKRIYAELAAKVGTLQDLIVKFKW